MVTQSNSIASKITKYYILFVAAVVLYGLLTDMSMYVLLATLSSIPCALGPAFLQKTMKLSFSNEFMVAYIVFLFGSQILGTTLDFYSYNIWDLIMHSMAGVLLGFAAISVFEVLRKDVKIPTLIIFLFVGALGLSGSFVWEVYEFTCDTLFGTEMQKLAISDTMSDMIAGCVGSFGVSYYYVKVMLKKTS
ncbi:MAG: hypothetical protein ACRCWQ_09740 [Bacilli bacterium]